MIGISHGFNFMENLFSFLGILLFVSIIKYIEYTFIQKKMNEKILGQNKIFLLYSVYFIIVFVVYCMKDVPYLLLPIPAAVMILTLLLDHEISIIMSMIITYISFLIIGGDLSFLLFFGITGIASTLIVQHLGKRNRIVSVTLLQIGVNLLLLFSLSEMNPMGLYEGVIPYFYVLINSVLSIIITVGSLPFFESVYRISTPGRLLDLTNPDQPLMKRLVMETPGTYHHSLTVANLAEAAAKVIGADPLLVKVGAYYHDIGKLVKPQYFKENQTVHNPHDDILPYNSAKIIIKHVADGVRLGEEYKLPKPVLDIIAQHHGTSTVKYFYFLAQKTGEEIKKEDYAYPGPNPISKESGIVMLADIIESAVRSLTKEKKNMEDIEVFMRHLIKDKMDEGQLDQCQLTMKDIYEVQKAFLSVFHGMYHDRIRYPGNETYYKGGGIHDHTVVQSGRAGIAERNKKKYRDSHNKSTSA